MTDQQETFYTSCYALDPKRRILILKMLPIFILFASMIMMMIVALLYQNMASDIPEDSQAKAQSLFMALFLLITTIPAATLFMCVYINKNIFKRAIHLNEEGIFEIKGKQERLIPWNSITRHRKTALGRQQHLTLYTAQGKLKLDATLIQAQEPLPKVKMDLRGEYLRYPDGKIQRLLIEESPLYHEIMKRTKNWAS